MAAGGFLWNKVKKLLPLAIPYFCGCAGTTNSTTLMKAHDNHMSVTAHC
jgi:hypothetical protein